MEIIVYAIMAFSAMGLLVVAIRARSAVRSIWVRIEDLQGQINGGNVRLYTEVNRIYSEFATEVHGKPVEFRSQHGEDVFLWKFFGRKEEGLCVEIGAFDGKSCSNTYAFEKLGWNCILIEPDPEMAEQCVSNRPKSKVIQAALGPRSATGTIEFHKVRTEANWSGMLSFTGDCPDHVERCRKHGARIESVPVPYRSFGSVMEECKEPINFMTIDVEGHELEVLEGIDFSLFSPEVIVIECTYDRERWDARKYLESNGYDAGEVIGCNQVFVRAGVFSDGFVKN